MHHSKEQLSAQRAHWLGGHSETLLGALVPSWACLPECYISCMCTCLNGSVIESCSAIYSFSMHAGCVIMLKDASCVVWHLVKQETATFLFAETSIHVFDTLCSPQTLAGIHAIHTTTSSCPPHTSSFHIYRSRWQWDKRLIRNIGCYNHHHRP